MAAPRLYVISLEEDDPRRCTAHRLRRFGLVEFTRRPRGIVLNPFAPELYMARRDVDAFLLATRGITAVDASWKKGEEWKDRFLGPYARRLPALLAANPVNYSRLGMLSTAEALAGALYIAGEKEAAAEMMSKFSWGHTFLELNRRALEMYSAADDMAESERQVLEHYAEVFRIP